MTPYTAMQLDTLREVANIGSGTASTALSQLLDRPVDISIPHARAISLADALDAVGPAEMPVTGVVIPVVGAIPALVLTLLGTDDGARLCDLLGVEDGSEVGISAMAEVGNILSTHYIGSLTALTGLPLEPEPPQVARDMLGAIVSTVLAERAGADDITLFIDSSLVVEGEECSLSFLYVPSAAGATELLTALGVVA